MLGARRRGRATCRGQLDDRTPASSHARRGAGAAPRCARRPSPRRSPRPRSAASPRGTRLDVRDSVSLRFEGARGSTGSSRDPDARPARPLPRPHRGSRAPPGAGAGHPRREPPVVPRLDLPAARDPAPGDVRRQGRVLRRPEDGVVLPGVGQIPIRREGGSASERALAAATEVLEAGGVFGIYPEGTRTRDGYLHRGHTGVARLALRTGAPIVPVGLVGTDECQPTDKKMPRVFRTRQDPVRRAGDRSRTTRASEHDRLVLRQITDEVMFEIQQLSGYEYVDTYATKQAEDVPTDPVPLADAPRPSRASRSRAQSSCAQPRARSTARRHVGAPARHLVGGHRRGERSPPPSSWPRPRRASPTRPRRAPRGRRRRARSSPAPRAGGRARRARRPGTGTAGPSRSRRRRRAARASSTPAADGSRRRRRAVCHAIDSTTARARCARPVPRVSPKIVPRAYGSHHGDPSPVNAGTNTTPPVSGTLSASGPVSAASAMIPSPSRSHWTAAPVTKIAPSIA